jgi:hypothetical protein
MWHDEAALVVNVLGKDFRALLGPLYFAEAGPPLFLWAERAVTICAGDGTFALRALSFLAGCLSLLLVWSVARKLLSGPAVPLAVLLVAFSNRLLWHACEAKPYAVDALVAIALPALIYCLPSLALTCRLAMFAALAPVAIFLSFPACFVVGGVLLAVLPCAWQQRRSSIGLTFSLACVSALLSFAILYIGPIRAQQNAEMASCWVSQFPNWNRPWTVPGWTVFSSLDVMRYCFEPSGHILALVAFVGVAAMWRNGHRGPIVLFGAPAVLAFAASLFHAYPWGGARIEVFLTPAGAIFAAAGAAPLWGWFQRRLPAGNLILAGVLVAPMALSSYRAVSYWPRADCAGAARYVLDHRRADDPVAANHWEYLYYFRRLGPAFLPLDTPLSRLPNDIWLVWTDAQPQGRRPAVLEEQRTEWQIVEEKDFFQSSVYKLRRNLDHRRASVSGKENYD